MRIVSGLAKDHRIPTVCILLVVAALVIGIAGCDGAGTYQFTIASGSCGNVTSPGEGTFTYPAGTVVQLVAEPADGYRFLSWTGDIAYIADPNAAYTTVTVNGNYAILANFEEEGETGPGDGGPFRP